MLTDILPFGFDLDAITEGGSFATAFVGTSLWSLALYLAFSPVSEWVTAQLQRWFNFAERSLYISKTEFEKTRQAREAQNAFYASVFSIVPFLAVGALSYWLVEISLGGSWAISMGVLASMGAGVYELGRRDGESSD